MPASVRGPFGLAVLENGRVVTGTITLVGMTDGTSNTFMVGEAAGGSNRFPIRNLDNSGAVVNDPFTGRPALLEQSWGATGFSDRLHHGEGVAVGMVLAAELSAELGLIAPADAARLAAHLSAVGLPTRLQDIGGFAQEGIGNADSLMALMAQDKKVKRGRLTFILLKSLGQAFISSDVEPAIVHAFLTRKLAAV